MVALSLTLVVGVVVILLAGVVNGVAGFGFALVATMALASLIDPATAVVFMIVPILAVNLSLVGDLSAEELSSCGRRFGPLLGAALVGTVGGMAVLDQIPARPLKLGLGVVTLSVVLASQDAVAVPGLSATREQCFVETSSAMLGIGALSGLVFGGTNVGIQLVAYLRSCDLSHGVFVGVAAMIFLGLNSVRVGAAVVLGLYPALAVVGASVLAALPAVVGVGIGKRLRTRVTASQRRRTVFGLQSVIGVRLLLAGAGVA